MSKQRKKKIPADCCDIFMHMHAGGFSGKQVHAETGYALIPKVKKHRPDGL